MLLRTSLFRKKKNDAQPYDHLLNNSNSKSDALHSTEYNKSFVIVDRTLGGLRVVNDKATCEMPASTVAYFAERKHHNITHVRFATKRLVKTLNF